MGAVSKSKAVANAPAGQVLAGPLFHRQRPHLFKIHACALLINLLTSSLSRDQGSAASAKFPRRSFGVRAPVYRCFLSSGHFFTMKRPFCHYVSSRRG